MPMIFPGMDPYLEDPAFWPDVHTRFTVYFAEFLQPSLRGRYVAGVEERVYVEEPVEDAGREFIPDVSVRPLGGSGAAAAAVLDADMATIVEVPGLEIREPFITILDRHSDNRIVTVIELVSPSNKYSGPGRDAYLGKQREVRGSHTHLVEIDLLRTGPHVLAVPEVYARAAGPYDYLVSICRAAGRRNRFALYRWLLADRLPRIRIPLAAGDPDVALDLQAVLEKTYEAGAFSDRLAYARPCHPPLTTAQQTWADERVREKTAAP